VRDGPREEAAVRFLADWTAGAIRAPDASQDREPPLEHPEVPVALPRGSRRSRPPAPVVVADVVQDTDPPGAEEEGARNRHVLVRPLAMKLRTTGLEELPSDDLVPADEPEVDQPQAVAEVAAVRGCTGDQAVVEPGLQAGAVRIGR
jgi:hypothetical protein